jgi:hypothetical protein
MATDPLENSLRETNWRGRLSAAEEAQLRSWLLEHPEAGKEWEIEKALTQALNGLADAPVSSNFTARVVQAAQREAAAADRASKPIESAWRWWVRWMPQAAGATLAIALGLVSYAHFREARRVELVRSVTTVTQVASVPSPQALEDFDAIQAMSQKPTADEELLKVLQ